MNIFGQPRKAGKARRDTPSGAVRGRVIAPRVRGVQVVVNDAEPIGTAMMGSLFMASATQSPMANGNGGGVTQNIGAGTVGQFHGRTGPLQDWRYLHGPVNDPRRSSVGIQGGPSSQPAFPSTGATSAPSIMDQLAMQSLPDMLR